MLSVKRVSSEALATQKHRSSNYDTFVQLDENVGKPREDIKDTAIPEENVFKETDSAPQEMSDFNRSSSYV